MSVCLSNTVCEMDLALRQSNMRRPLTCSICQKLFRQVTTLEECCHLFCDECITKEIAEGSHNCPICKVDLGSAPLQRLRVDHHWQRILEKLNERKRENRECEFPKDRTKSPQVPKQDEKRIDANMLATEASLRTRASLRNEKQKYFVDALTSDKLRSTWRPISEHDEGKDVRNITSTLNQCRELRTRRREENSIFGAPKRSRNPTKILIDTNNDEYNEKVKTFWFSLIASDNQKCKAPLEQIPCRYLRVKDGNITVSSIKKYLMQKLNLRSENEVEISLQGRLLLPTLEMRKLIDLWLHTNTTAPLQKKKALVGSSARDFVLTLTYARRPKST